MATIQPLFGGAIACAIPNGWRDVSDARQVPDNQVCWQDTEGRLLVVEILEWQETVDDTQAAAYFFQDLAEANGTSAQDRTFTAQPSNLIAIPGLPADSTTLCFGTGFQRVALGRDVDIAGNPRQQEVRWIQVELCVIRLRSVNTDLLVTLSTPSEPNPQTTDSNPTNLFRNIVTSLQIRDWSLFGGGQQ